MPSYWDARSIDTSSHQSARTPASIIKTNKTGTGGKNQKTLLNPVITPRGFLPHRSCMCRSDSPRPGQKEWDTRAEQWEDGEGGKDGRSWFGSPLSARFWQTDGEWGSPDVPVDVSAPKTMPCVRMFDPCLTLSPQTSCHCKWSCSRTLYHVIYFWLIMCPLQFIQIFMILCDTFPFHIFSPSIQIFC